MGYRVLFALLIMFVMVACRDSASRSPAAQLATSANATFPTLTANPILLAAFTVGTLLQSSGASPSGE